MQMKPEMKHIGLRRWAYAFPRAEAFNLQCNGRVAGGAIRLNGTGVFEVPPGCAALGDRFVIPSRLEAGRTVVEGRRVEDMAVFGTATSLRDVLQKVGSISASKEDSKGIRLMKIADELQDEEIVNSTVAQVSEALQKNYQQATMVEEDTDWSAVVWEHGPMTMGSAALVGLTALSLWVCARRRARTPPNDGNAAAAATLTAPMVTNAKLEMLTEVVIRVAKLEERVEGFARDLETLKRFM